VAVAAKVAAMAEAVEVAAVAEEVAAADRPKDDRAPVRLDHAIPPAAALQTERARMRSALALAAAEPAVACSARPVLAPAAAQATSAARQPAARPSPLPPRSQSESAGTSSDSSDPRQRAVKRAFNEPPPAQRQHWRSAPASRPQQSAGGRVRPAFG
jgi:hypothetical protein